MDSDSSDEVNSADEDELNQSQDGSCSSENSSGDHVFDKHDSQDDVIIDSNTGTSDSNTGTSDSNTGTSDSVSSSDTDQTPSHDMHTGVCSGSCDVESEIEDPVNELRESLCEGFQAATLQQFDAQTLSSDSDTVTTKQSAYESERRYPNCEIKTEHEEDFSEGSDAGTVEEGSEDKLCLSRQLTSGHVHPVGGSESEYTSHISKHTSGMEALQLVESFMRRGQEASFDTAVETRGLSEDGVKEVHVHLTQTNIHNPAAITLGGQVVVNPPTKAKKKKKTAQPSQLPPTELQKLRSETENRLEKWAENMVFTRGAQAVLNKINQGKTLVTITGSPGEGKTTTGYLVLKRLHSMGRLVYDITTPEDYFKAKDSKQPIVMINDIFGSLNYDLDKRWKEVLNDILAMNEHKREKDVEHRERMKPPRLTVLLISRSSVLKEASYHMGRLKDLILNEEALVDLTHGTESAVEERLEIWKVHSDKYQITIDEKIVREVCQKNFQHGFPHCCRLFAAMYADNKLNDMKAFFSTPLEFLNQTMESLIMDRITGPFLRELLKNNGMLYLDDVSDDERRFQYSSIVDILKGTYLSQEDDKVTFHHPSVYDSAAFVVCLKDPLFVINNCSLSFLKERVRFETIETGNSKDCDQIVTAGRRYISKYLDRLKTEFEKENLFSILSQDSFNDERFTLQFMQRVLPVNKLDSNEEKSFSEDVQNLMYKQDRTSKKTFLYLSTKSKSDKVLKYICRYVDFTENDLKEALFGVCSHNSVSSLKLLDRKYDLNMKVKDMNSQTPLLLAAANCSDEMLKLLLQKDVDIGAVDKNGNSALHIVCRHGIERDGNIVKTLVEKGANVFAESSDFPFLPLSIACYEGHTNIVMSLLDIGDLIGVNTPNSVGTTPLHEASWMGHTDVTRLLLERGADANISNGKLYDCKTPLHDASRSGHLNVVKILLQHGADINKTSDKGVTPLHDASWNGHSEVVKLLLENGADVNRTNGDEFHGQTALHDACSQGYIDVVLVLLGAGADVHKSNNLCETPLHYACRTRSIDIAAALIKKGADVSSSTILGVTPLHDACWNGRADIVTLLLDEGADIDKPNSVAYHANTPLHDACSQGHYDVVKILLERGGDANKRTNDGKSPLHYACGRGWIKVVTLLLQNGACATDVSDSGVTPLHDSCWNGHADVVQLLLQHGAEINKPNGDIHRRKTPLLDACSRGHLHVVKVLLENGTDVKKTDLDGRTPLDVARSRGYEDIVALF